MTSRLRSTRAVQVGLRSAAQAVLIIPAPFSLSMATLTNDGCRRAWGAASRFRCQSRRIRCALAPTMPSFSSMDRRGRDITRSTV